jgi:hypothetical protein
MPCQIPQLPPAVPQVVDSVLIALPYESSDSSLTVPRHIFHYVIAKLLNPYETVSVFPKDA